MSEWCGWPVVDEQATWETAQQILTDAELSDGLRQLSSDMANTAIESGGKSKGKLVLTLDFALEGRVFTISAKHKIDVPEPKRPKSVMWSTQDGRFTPSNPQQGQLFGVREVGAPAIRDAG